MINNQEKTMEKPFEVCAEIEDDEDHYRVVSRHSSKASAERVASQWERDHGVTTWVDGPEADDME